MEVRKIEFDGVVAVAGAPPASESSNDEVGAMP